jgi:hypothetical protein
MSVMVSMMYICDVSFICLDGIGKTNKKDVYWSLCRVLHSAKTCFAECQGHSTRQRTNTWAQYSFFAECCGPSTRQRDPALPSAAQNTRQRT